MKKYLPYIIIAVVFLAIGFGVGFEYQAYRITRAFQQAFTNTTVKEATSTASSTPTPATAMQEAKNENMKTIDKKVGDELTLDTGKVTVNSLNEMQILSYSHGNPAVAVARTKFVVINLTLTNITKSDFTFSPDEAFTLIEGIS